MHSPVDNCTVSLLGSSIQPAPGAAIVLPLNKTHRDASDSAHNAITYKNSTNGIRAKAGLGSELASGWTIVTGATST